MHLISLEIQGFKSFADRTVIHFHEGVTAIVGPNGSGKSNVTDAIRWVLGEQSAKTLRGGKMEDVIFSGTKTRRPLSFAEVTMILDNSDGSLPVEYREVAVTRRLYRSGESNYLINKQACRLKDIHALFMDTGLGKDAYSIISQGRVDEILSSKSEDRRKVFEEASGIQKFKVRRDEALRRLENSEANLMRVSDIINEISGQLLPLSRQAEQAQKYLEYYEELKSKDLALSLDDIDRRTAENKTLGESIQRTAAELEESLNEGLKLESENRELRSRQEELKQQIEQSEQLREDERRADRALESKRSEYQEQLAVLKANRAILDQNQIAVSSRLDELKLELDEKTGTEQNSEEAIGHANTLVSEREEACRTFAKVLEASLQRITELRRQRSEIQQSMIRLQTEKSSVGAGAEVLETERERHKGELEALESGLQKSRLEQEEAKLKAEACRQQTELIRTQYDEENQRLAEIRQKLQDEQEAYNRLLQTLDQQSYRLQTLEQMERSHEGYNEPVRQILKRCAVDRHYEGRIFGTVADNLRTDARYETAIETALGAAMQNIVTDHSGTASELIAVLKREKLGRVTFLPLASLKANPLQDSVQRRLREWTGRGYLGQANELIRCESQMETLFKQLLGRVVVCETLKDADAVAKAFGQTLRIVTLEGDVISPGGAMSGGAYKRRGSSFIARRREADEIERNITELERGVGEREAQIERQNKALRLQAERLDKVSLKGMEAQEAALRADAVLRAAEGEISRLEHNRRLLNERLEALNLRETTAGQQQQELDSRIKELEEENKQIEQQLNLQEAGQSESLRQRDELRDSLNEARLELNRLLERRQAEKSLSERVQNEISRQQAEMQRIQNERQALDSRVLQHEKELGGILDEIQNRLESAKEKDAHLQALAEQNEQMSRRSAELFDRLKIQSDTLNKLESEKNRLDLRFEQNRDEIDRQKNRLWESYNLTYDQAADYRIADFPHAEYKERSQFLKAQIRKMGTVNVNAVEDYRVLSERHEFLKKQENDILAAREQLQKLVDELTAGMREMFAENFARIDLYFREVFKELFGGGQAQITLGEGKDVLDAEIEIKASPPGKKLQNMLLLSGGERSLAAIALLFAILKLRPTPFCVLDEIEAALDDGNVFRFTNYIKKYSEQSQFILVTHRKGTMEASDTLYGVTMQERGVSRILSMRLSDEES